MDTGVGIQLDVRITAGACCLDLWLVYYNKSYHSLTYMGATLALDASASCMITMLRPDLRCGMWRLVRIVINRRDELLW